MASFSEEDICDNLLLEVNVSAIKTIQIKTNKLATDKGKLKQKDAASFESWKRSKIFSLKFPEKCSSFKVRKDKNCDNFLIESNKSTASSKHWLPHINDKDSLDILKNMRNKTEKRDLNQALFNRIHKDNFISLSEEEINSNEQILDMI